MTSIIDNRKYPVSKNVLRYIFGKNSIHQLKDVLAPCRSSSHSCVVYCIDHFFRGKELLSFLPVTEKDAVLFVDTTDEPKTTGINRLVQDLRRRDWQNVVGVVGIGGGATLDTAKAISNLLTNEGLAEEYQGWDLVKKPGVFKVGIPTLSGTGAESSRTCVMTNPKNGLKLGMNSDFTIFDFLILDPELSVTVPRDQFFFTGCDTYIHCIESLGGKHRHALSDAFSRQALDLCRKVFFEAEDMKSPESREDLMVASYLGGCAIANSFVGLVHPFSAGLSVVLGLHHGVANCVALNALSQFYPKETEEFRRMAEKQNVAVPQEVCKGLGDKDFEALYNATIIHEKPLINALGEDFRQMLTPQKVKEIFSKM